ncbi:hypothetical protein ACI4X5_000490 [Campylobacter upsaliensis]|uniref:Uncharacterized protein n=1 Tax=Campylobacter upsaliensis TaxID=28080 RepID=A0A7U8B4B6_CAMUP|nr:hypothetical protein [Campylobacter upsaliensis]EFN3492657.1 hypothetical protein [Campylobacter jejuni]EAI3920856.1 hypothetical protein [Campylobacter upsaliensis]EAI7244179.1 hypothetical protein [Campylobacter upsaliensis]EAJ1622370.1 hypothetical protein [Campylobacter upsaliensis]EAJ1689509.1 hypothetical protein [Campylobacter upsaliensis]
MAKALKNVKEKYIQHSLFDVVEKIEKSTSSIDELRVPIFAPISQINKNSSIYKSFVENKNIRTIETKWGAIEIRNRILTQTHKDILDLIFTYADEIQEQIDGSVMIKFTRSKILQEYTQGEYSSKNFKWFKEKLLEIKDSVIRYKDKNDRSFAFNIIDTVIEDRNNFGIIISKSYVNFYEKSLSVNYKKEIPRLLEIENSLLKAIVRFFFSHTNCNIKIDDLFITLGFPMESTRWLQISKKEIRESIDILAGFGIHYDEKKEVFYYQGNKNINVIPAVSKDKNKN